MCWGMWRPSGVWWFLFSWPEWYLYRYLQVCSLYNNLLCYILMILYLYAMFFISIKITQLILSHIPLHLLCPLLIHQSYKFCISLFWFIWKNHNILSIPFLLIEKGSMYWYWRRKFLEIKSNYIKNYVKLRLFACTQFLAASQVFRIWMYICISPVKF